MPCSTPVIFLIFCRPDLTAQVFEVIRQAQPIKLLIVADGPRDDQEATFCQQARAVTEQVDWDCEVLRNYSEVNLGCRERVSSGITWAFEQVEEAIILEDDCLPHPDFFFYCSKLLKLYRYDTRIASICGSNFQEGIKRGTESFYFSQYADPWGWATWKRAWSLYDNYMKNWPKFKADGRIKDLFSNSVEQNYWVEIFDKLYSQNAPDSWFYRWQLSIWMNHSLSIWPNICLVSNTGFGDSGTHCKSPGRFSNLNFSSASFAELSHPEIILADRNADQYLFLFRHNGINLMEKEKYGYCYSWLIRYRRLKDNPLKFIRSGLSKLIKIVFSTE